MDCPSCGTTNPASARFCMQCGGDIPFERLQAQPTALRCIACQSEYEKTHPPAPRLAM